MEVYNEQTILNAVQTEWAGKTVHFVKKTDSTNILAKRLAREGAPHGTVAVAELQTAGRGRFRRTWTAPEGSSVMMTIVLRPEFSPLCASMLTLVMGLSVAQAAGGLGFSAAIKWPNDVVVSGRKICGILTEMSADVDKIHHVVIGAGINVNTREFPPEVADKATSLYLEGKKEFSRCRVLAAVLECFEKNYDKFVQTCDLSLLKGDYEKMLANLGRPVRVLDTQEPYEGVALGINDRGELLVRRKDSGAVCRVGAGEVSVRGLYSYV